MRTRGQDSLPKAFSQGHLQNPEEITGGFGSIRHQVPESQK